LQGACDYDDQGKPLPEWIEFRKKLKPFDGVLFVTPEYDRSVPGVLKNAIDVFASWVGINAGK